MTRMVVPLEVSAESYTGVPLIVESVKSGAGCPSVGVSGFAGAQAAASRSKNSETQPLRKWNCDFALKKGVRPGILIQSLRSKDDNHSGSPVAGKGFRSGQRIQALKPQHFN